MRVAICIGTFHRTKLLRQLLNSLSRLTFHKRARPAFEVFVVDNDPNGSASETFVTTKYDYPIRYVIEPRRGIASVRNRAIQEAQSCDSVAFLDDDEVVSPEWLDELLWTQARFGLDVVAGPVRPHFVNQTPEWVKKSGCFCHREYETGTLLDKCSTGNVLISASVFEAVAGFDERFQLTGGEDTHFFLQVRRAGFQIGWSQQAVVHEEISRERANLRWILHRGFQLGNSWVLSEELLEKGARFRRVSRFCKACVHMMNGLAVSLPSVFFSRGLAAKYLREAFLGAGKCAGLFGLKYQAYRSANPASSREVAKA